MSFQWLYRSLRASLRKPGHAEPILHAGAEAGPIKEEAPVQESAPRKPEEAVGMESSHGEHCPFLNRSDHRCAEHFNLDQLDFALEHCFDQYQTCPIYFELLNERLERRYEGATAPAASQRQQPRIRSPWKGSRTTTNDGRLVQVQIPARYTKQSA